MQRPSADLILSFCLLQHRPLSNVLVSLILILTRLNVSGRRRVRKRRKKCAPRSAGGQLGGYVSIGLVRFFGLLCVSNNMKHMQMISFRSAMWPITEAVYLSRVLFFAQSGLLKISKISCSSAHPRQPSTQGGRRYLAMRRKRRPPSPPSNVAVKHGYWMLVLKRGILTAIVAIMAFSIK